MVKSKCEHPYVCMYRLHFLENPVRKGNLVSRSQSPSNSNCNIHCQIDDIITVHNKMMFIRTRRLFNAIRQFTVYVRININSKLFRLVEKIKCLISNCTAAMLLSSFAIVITKQLTLSVTWPFDSSLALYYKWSIATMRLSCTIMEIWRFKDYGITTLTFRGHVTSSVTWPFDSRWATSYGWSVVTMHLSCTVMEIWRLKFWTHGRTDAQVIKKRTCNAALRMQTDNVTVTVGKLIFV